MDAELLATWTLVSATAVLAVLTGVLAYHAKRQADAVREAGEDAKAQAQAAADSLELSRRILAEGERQWAARAPLALRVALPTHVAGHAVVELLNAAADAVMVLEHGEIAELPAGPVLESHALAEGTLGVGQGWSIPMTWDYSRRGLTIAVRATGHRLGGPSMVQEFRFRVDAEGRLDDLASTVPVAMWA